MLKKALLVVLVFSMIMDHSIAEESENGFEVEELSPIIKCDEQYNECAEKCEDSILNTCIGKCKAVADECYNNVLSETESEEEDDSQSRKSEME